MTSIKVVAVQTTGCVLLAVHGAEVLAQGPSAPWSLGTGNLHHQAEAPAVHCGVSNNSLALVH